MAKIHKLLTILFVFGLSACSPSNPNSEVSLAPQVKLESLSALTKISGSAEFGVVSKTKTNLLVLKNLTTEVSEVALISITGAQASAFALTYASGCGVALPSLAACSVKVTFNAANKAVGAYQAVLNVGALSVPLSASIEAPMVASVTVFEGSSEINAGVNLGNLQGAQSVTKILTVKNLGATPSEVLDLSLTNSNFSLVSSSCAGKSLPAGASCAIKLSFSAMNKIAQVYLADLLMGSRAYPLSAQVVNPILGAAGGVEIETTVNNELLAAEDLDLGVFPETEGVSKLITFKNVGTATSQPMTATLSSGIDYQLISNTCINKVLPPNAQCMLRLVFSSLGKNVGAYNVSLNFNEADLGINAVVVGACAPTTHFEKPNCVADIQPCGYANGTGRKNWNANLQGYDACYPIACDSGFDLANNQCLTACAASDHRNPASFVCEANVISCSIANAASATRTWNGSAYGACTVVACATDFHNESNTCVADLQACPINNGTGTKLWNGSAYNACVVASCNSTFHNESNACVSDVRACAVAQGSGTETWNGSGYNTCVVDTCVSGYHVEANACLNDVRACAIVHGAGTQQWMGNQYSACTAQSCDSAYHLFNNQCDLDVIDCAASVTHAATATQTWNISGQVYDACVVSACASNYDLISNDCYSSCAGNQHHHPATQVCENNVISCVADISNSATATRTWNPGTQNYNACVLGTCSATYHINGNLCDANVIDCTANISNAAAATQTWNGSTYNSCVVATCVAGYHVAANACVVDPENYWGDSSDGALDISSSLSLPSSTDGDMVVRKYSSLRIRSGATLTTQTRARGLTIYVEGDAIIEGTLSMEMKGASGDPSSYGVSSNGLRWLRKVDTGGSVTASGSSISGVGSAGVAAEANQPAANGNGVYITVARDGASGAPAVGGYGNGYTGYSGATQSGGGGGGGGVDTSSGGGSYGSCFVGGSGGGAGGYYGGGGYASAYGGQGGYAAGAHPNNAGAGGAGNPVGGASLGNGSASNAPGGGGGLLVLVVKGNLTVVNGGRITVEGSRGGDITWAWHRSGGGGGAGGGNLVIIHGGTYSNSGTVTAAGGRGGLAQGGAYSNNPGGAGGAGSIQVVKVKQ